MTKFRAAIKQTFEFNTSITARHLSESQHTGKEEHTHKPNRSPSSIWKQQTSINLAICCYRNNDIISQVSRHPAGFLIHPAVFTGIISNG